MKVEYKIIEIESLRSHEEIRPELLEKLVVEIQNDGYLKRPILVERRFLVILDGHHRYEALKKLGCKRVPILLVNYDDESITLTTWPDAVYKVVSKGEVLERGRNNRLYPPKTTRHIIDFEIKDHPVNLYDLM